MINSDAPIDTSIIDNNRQLSDLPNKEIYENSEANLAETSVENCNQSVPNSSTESALVSPDSQNNNRRNSENPCLISPEKEPKVSEICETKDSDRSIIRDRENPGDKEISGKILFSDDNIVHIVEDGVDNAFILSDCSETPFVAQSLIGAVYYRKVENSNRPQILRYQLIDNTEPSDSKISAGLIDDRILLCLPCKLSLSSSKNLEFHVKNYHSLDLSDGERRTLFEDCVSAIVQEGPKVSLLKLKRDSTEGREETVIESTRIQTPKTPSEITSEEIARNLMLASELSASRLLQQVSQNALAASMSFSGGSELLQGCAMHPDGKSASVDCGKCDLILGTKPAHHPPNQFLHSAAAARNSCKTLKCPKCNWHYKYQETLEIHMKEKHPDSEVTCGYCLHNQTHPKLARGETYGCGYKPYRCEICKYSTTTKGNLSIHMQSDKHLNNVQELQQGGSLIDPNSLIHAPQITSTPARLSPSASSGDIAPNANNRPPSASNTEKLRCDVCNYETTVGRNLRIHMTSEKHAQNTLLLQRKLALVNPSGNWADLGQLGQNFGGGYGLPGLDTASLLAFQRLEGGRGASAHELECANCVFQCYVCMRFAANRAEELIGHVQADRSQPGPQDISVIQGNFFCNLCQYKTHLKANFQLHTKTDKHLQRLMLVNHVREGGPDNERRLCYLNVNNPVHMRCNACGEFFTSTHKLQLHSVSPRHCGFQKAFIKIQEDSCSDSESQFCCVLCKFSGKRDQILQHLHTPRHREALNLSGDLDSGDWIQVSASESSLYKDSFEEDESCEEEDYLDEEPEEMIDAIHCCAWCNYTCKTNADLQKHDKLMHGNGEENGLPVNEEANSSPESNIDEPNKISLACPLCQINCGFKRQQVELHLSQVHNVTEKGIRRLMPMVPAANDPSHPSSANPSLSPPASVPADSTTQGGDSDGGNPEPRSSSPGPSVDSSGVYACSVCAVKFSNCEELYDHQSESGHLELKQTPHGPGYLCWHKGCNQYFKNAATVQVHFREIHAKKSPLAGCVSDRHVYKYRCSQCSLAFRTEAKLQEHSIYHLMRASTKCAICGRNFRKIDALRRHVEATHGGENGVNGVDGSAEQEGEGEEACGQEFDEKPSLNGGASEEDRLNSQPEAEIGYNDSNRKFKCHKCKLGFTKQGYLAVHQKTLVHRRGEKISYSMEKFLDPNRPFKCHTCKESFTQKPILFVHFNSVSHLHKMKKLMEQQNPDLNLTPQDLANLNRDQTMLTLNNAAANLSPMTPNGTTTGSNTANKGSQQMKGAQASGSKQLKSAGNLGGSAGGLKQGANGQGNGTKPYRCNICKMAWNQGSTLDIHVRSLAHDSRMKKILELVSAGEIDPNLPVVEQPDFVNGNEAGRQLISDLVLKKLQQSSASKQQQQQMESAAMLVNMMSAQFPAFLMQAFQQQQQQQMYGIHTCPTCNSMFSSEADLKSHQSSVCGGGAHSGAGARPTGSAGRKGTPVKREVSSSVNPHLASDSPLMNGHNSHENPESPSPEDIAGRGLIKSALGGRHGGTFKRLLEDYGFEVVMQYNEMIQQRKQKNMEMQAKKETEQEDNEVEDKKLKIEELEDDSECSQMDIPEIQKSICSECGKTFSSIWVLKAHFEQVHKAQTVSEDAVEVVGEQIKSAIEQKIKSSPTESPVKSDQQTEATQSTVDSAVSSVISQVTKASPRAASPAAATSASGPVQKQQTPGTPVTSQPTPTSLATSQLSMGGAFLPGFPFMPAGFGNPFGGAFPNPFMSPFMMPTTMASGTDPGNSLPEFLRNAVAASGAAQNASAQQTLQNNAAMAAAAAAQQAQAAAAAGKRARTRITDDQLKVLRDYFDINNSPTEQQIEEMSIKSGLPQKVIKHWFRNTLFKERQRNKDSPYNFSIPPSLGIDLEEYEKTGEAKVIPYKEHQDSTSAGSLSTPQKEEAPDILEESKLVIDEKVQPSSDDFAPSEEAISVKKEPEEPIEKPETNVQKPAVETPRVPSDLLAALNMSPQALLSAQETLRQLTAGQMAPFAGGNPFSLLAATQQHLVTSAEQAEKAGLSAAAASMCLPISSQSPPSTSCSSDTMTSLIASAMTPGGSLSGPGRRANRTRFSDYQLKELQDFFEKQAYPKDDDLEFLSKRLQLSPRVIVVWFQNARQKARKVYENQPHSEADRFVKTPGCNFQCKRCSLVFQRYYELIQHQQKQCYKDDSDLIGEHQSYSRASETSSKSPRNCSDVSSTKSGETNLNDEFFCEKCGIFFNGPTQLEEHLKVHAKNPLLFAEDPNTSTSNVGAKRKLSQLLEDSESKRPRSTPRLDTVLCMGNTTRSGSRDRRSTGNKSPPSFNKRCPFCGILFHTKSSMESHLQTRHSDQCQKTIVNIDLLPDAEEVPTITTSAADLLMSGSGLAHSLLSFGMLPGAEGLTSSSTPGSVMSASAATNPVDLMKKLTEGLGGGSSPLDLTRPVTVKTEAGEDRSRSGSGSPKSPNFSYCQSDNEDSQSTFSQDLDSSSPALANQLRVDGTSSANQHFSRPPSKRFRTHLSPMQVNVMKHLFGDYKTPSMAECELLGSIVGLHKRVVQVWFQNARAKERKHKAATGESPRAQDLMKFSGSTRCALCNVEYSQKNSPQDHIFSREHIDKIREYLKLHGTEETPASMMNRASPASSVSRNQSPRVPLSRSSSSQALTSSRAAEERAATSAADGVNASNSAAAMAAAAQNLLAGSNPYMNPAAYYNNLASSMMYSAGLSGLPAMAMMDPTVYGTPVNMLQIPLAVMQLITTRMQDGSANSVSFTQDGLKVEELRKALGDPKDVRCAGQTDLEVGWACRKCAMVFQSEAQFLNHERMVCQGSGQAFRLIQIHYDCRACCTKFGTQAEFKKHCETDGHIAKAAKF